jgi:hypothetical protein
LKTAILLGLSYSDWENITPYELSVCSEGYIERKEMESHEAITMVWLGEHFHRSKRLPELNKLLNRTKQKKQMTDEEMLNTVKRLNAQFGGSVISADPVEGS